MDDINQLSEWVTTMCQKNQPIRFNDGWTLLHRHGIVPFEEILRSGYQHPFGKRGFSLLYTISFNMCAGQEIDVCKRLYHAYVQVVRDYLQQTVKTELVTKHGPCLIKAFARHWNNQKLYIMWLTRLFMHLDNRLGHFRETRTRSGTDTMYFPVFSQGMQMFYNEIVSSIKTDLVKIICTQVDRKRRGDLIDEESLRICSTMFIELGAIIRNEHLNSLSALRAARADYFLYMSILEKAVLDQAVETYESTSVTFSQTYGLFQYTREAEHFIEREIEMFHLLFTRSSEPKVVKALTDAFLRHKVESLVEKSSDCFENGTVDDWRLVFRLFRQIPDEIQSIATAFSFYISKSCCDCIQLLKPPNGKKQEYVFLEKLLALRHSYFHTMQIAFEANPLLDQAFHQALRTILMHHVGSDRLSRILSNYADRLLRKGYSESSLDDILAIFSYIQDKDYFLEYYRDQMAKRLLLLSRSRDSEKHMIGRLKTICGRQFTSKLESMIHDLDVSEEISRDFDHIWLKPQVLTSGMWPSYPQLKPLLPSDIQTAYQLFETFYSDRQPHRKLNFLYSVSQVTVTMRWQQKSIELFVVPCQALVLLLFNTTASSSIGFQQIQDATQLDTGLLKRVLHSLSCAAIKILTKVSETDQFCFNDSLQCSSHKVRVPMATVNVGTEAAEKTVQIERIYTLDAAIVRIMKARKKVSHVALMTELAEFNGLFQPTPKLIKQRIADLINRDYIKRTTDGSYEYMA